MGEETIFYDQEFCLLIKGQNPSFTIRINPKNNEVFVTVPKQVIQDGEKCVVDMIIDMRSGFMILDANCFANWRLTYEEYKLMRESLGLNVVTDQEYTRIIKEDDDTLRKNVQASIPIPQELNPDVQSIISAIPPQPPQPDPSA